MSRESAGGTLKFRCRQIRILLRQKEHSHCQRLFRGQHNASSAKQERPRNGGQNSHAITALAIRGDSAAMRQASQRGQRVFYDFVVILLLRAPLLERQQRWLS